MFQTFFICLAALIHYGTIDLPRDQVVEVSRNEGFEQRLADVSSTSSDKEEEEEGDANGEEGGDSKEESEENEEDPTDRATLREILAKVTTLALPLSNSYPR